tara:strand:- start:2007 stop:2717 length:711 start_codon:yes stop_codon:yes gene_type:complete
MAIRKVAPIKKKKVLSISSKGNLVVSTSRTNEDKKDPRVFIASSSPSVPVTEVRLNNLSQDKREEWDILFNQNINPVNFIRTFQEVVTSNLLLIPDVPKEEVLSQIDEFINSTAGVVVQAIEQQRQYFTEDEIVEQQEDLNVVIQNITQAQTNISSAAISVSSGSVNTTEAPKLTDSQKELQELLSKEKEAAIVKEKEAVKKKIEPKRDPESLLKEGYKQVGPTTFIDGSGNKVEL